MAVDDMAMQCLSVVVDSIQFGPNADDLAGLCKRHMPGGWHSVLPTSLPNVVQVWTTASWKDGGFLCLTEEPNQQ